MHPILSQHGAPAATAGLFAVPDSRWDASHAASLDPVGLLVYRSNLLGQDLSITNYGGGNTSAKLEGLDPLSREPAKVLWVKGSGGDLGSMGEDGFATLCLDRLRQLESHYGGPADEDRMAHLLGHCTYGLNPRAASIDTPLHALLPASHIDHLHPDAVIALAAAGDGEAAVGSLWGGRVGWLPWMRPGFGLALMLRGFAARNPQAVGAVLAGHGLICWADSAESCYRLSLELVGDAAHFLNGRLAGRALFGGLQVAPLAAADRRAALVRLLPRLRGLLRTDQLKVAHVADDDETMAFVGSADCARLADIGTSCPDHFLRTKIRPLLLDPDRLDDGEWLAAAIARYRADYAAYHARHAGADDPPLRDADPVVLLLPGIGRIAFARDRATARIASEFYGNAINVMRGAEALGGYHGLDEREAFRIEYWALEEAKLRRLPPPLPLAGRIALVTGAAGAIGRASAHRLAADGACVLLTDIDAAGLDLVTTELSRAFGHDRLRSHVADVADETSLADAFAAAVLAFGGLDILVANAGIASAAPIADTDLALWRRNHDILAQGYFLCARSAFPLMRAGGGGAIVFIGSKNAVAATPNASAYSSAKAAALHLARCLALEGAPDGIRVNVVNPDAVIRGSRIWDGAWRRERAEAHGIDAGAALEEHYRQRSLLKVHVLPEDVAEAVAYFASDRSAKSTGNMLNVDAGNAQAFSR
ncbi:MAG: bifunctional rhamnulose-1-phosphate aldolase/short-chain dehydrogenase [Sandarakinorhabdus sp.]|nr:bifunctional rhamnulose-1-phosphate aldolase/short-chain dehydrogenase [Sandarakinorhabdus sp.]